MARILVLCPSHRDYRELSRFRGAHDFLFREFASADLEAMLSPFPPARAIRDVRLEVDEIVERHGAFVDAVVSTDDYPGSTLASIVASRLGLAGTAPKANLLCQHKYYSREAQKRAGVQGTPDFQRIREPGELELALPCFVKPVKSFFSIGGARVRREDRLAQGVRSATLPENFHEPFRALFEAYAGLPFGDARVIAERLLAGSQATLEGYAFHGEVRWLGVVDSIMYPGSMVFRRFSYPSMLPAGAISRMEEIGREALRAVGFDHGLFNIEFFYDRERESVHVIEINPRMASQFADLYEKVDGTSTYAVLLDLALGRRPAVRFREGRHKAGLSQVLRRFRDGEVLRVPSPEDLAVLAARHPDMRVEILVSAGRRLSHELQDGRSFRYGILNVGGCSHEAALKVAAACRRSLTFEFCDGETMGGAPRGVQPTERCSAG